MTCPFCGHREDKVIDSRESKEGDVIRRRRQCLACERRFTTYERSDEIPYMVIKKDGRREKFDRQKPEARLYPLFFCRECGQEVHSVSIERSGQVIARSIDDSNNNGKLTIGGGIVSLQAVNSYRGDTTVSSGTLQISGPGTAGLPANSIVYP